VLAKIAFNRVQHLGFIVNRHDDWLGHLVLALLLPPSPPTQVKPAAGASSAAPQTLQKRAPAGFIE
jgi:hypothetical protein